MLQRDNKDVQIKVEVVGTEVFILPVIQRLLACLYLKRHGVADTDIKFPAVIVEQNGVGIFLLANAVLRLELDFVILEDRWDPQNLVVILMSKV